MSAAETSSVKQPESAAHMLRKWFENQVRMQPDEIDLRALTAKATNDLGGDPVFQAAIIEQGIAMIMPMVAHQHWTKERRGRDRITDSKDLLPKDNSVQIAERLNKWYEHVGESIHKRLGAMTRPDLMFAAEQREKRVHTEQKTIRFERTLAKTMPNDSITVERFFRPEQIASIWNTTFESGQ